MKSRWLLISGAVISIFWIIDLIWSQVDLNLPSELSGKVGYRFQLATGSVTIIGIGLLVIIGARILDAVEARRSVPFGG